MNENDFSANFDAEDAFASRMDYMRRKRRRRRREVEKEAEEEEEEKVRRQDCRTDKKMHAKAESFRTSSNFLRPNISSVLLKSLKVPL
jgi:hypothetical protein